MLLTAHCTEADPPVELRGLPTWTFLMRSSSMCFLASLTAARIEPANIQPELTVGKAPPAIGRKERHSSLCCLAVLSFPSLQHLSA